MPRSFPKFLRGLPDGSVVMCNPGFVDAELQRLDPLTTTLREREYIFLIDSSFLACSSSAWPRTRSSRPKRGL
jgi:hypothetical protein